MIHHDQRTILYQYIVHYGLIKQIHWISPYKDSLIFGIGDEKYKLTVSHDKIIIHDSKKNYQCKLSLVFHQMYKIYFQNKTIKELLNTWKPREYSLYQSSFFLISTLDIFYLKKNSIFLL